jgi:hypothetical protein
MVVLPVECVVGQVVLVLDLAEDLLRDVFERHDAGCGAVFADHDGEVLAAFTQLAQQGPEVLGLRDDRRGLGVRADRRVAVGAGGGDELSGMNDAREAVE